MTAGIVIGYDATHENIASLPKGAQVAGYSTGSVEIAWTATDWSAHPGALRYCQDPGATDDTADVLDVESGAATVADCPGWVLRARVNWNAGTRPGQRKPAIYCDADNVTPVANALIAGGVPSGVGLVVANWSLTVAQAVEEVAAAAGPFPIVGVQYKSDAAYDIDAWDGAWLAETSAHPAPPAPKGPYRQVLGDESIRQFASARGGDAAATLNRSPALWTPADKEAIVDLVLPGFIVYTVNP